MGTANKQQAINPAIPNQEVVQHDRFSRVCQDMYKRFGAVYTNLKPLARTELEVNFIVQQLHGLRDAMRELLEQSRNFPKEDGNG